jgi:peroxiredoxin
VFRTWSLRAHSQLIPFPHDQAIALFFFPKANTMGCTKEACAFRDARQDNPTFKRYGDDKLVVIGVSGGESSLLSLRATTTDAHRHQTPHPLNPRSSISTTSDTLS